MGKCNNSPGVPITHPKISKQLQVGYRDEGDTLISKYHESQQMQQIFPCNILSSLLDATLLIDLS